MDKTTTTPRGIFTALKLPFRNLRLTGQPETAAEQQLNSSVVWLALMAYWASVAPWQLYDLACALRELFPMIREYNARRF